MSAIHYYLYIARQKPGYERMFYGIIETCKLHYRSGNIRYSAIGKKSKIDAGGCSDNIARQKPGYERMFYGIIETCKLHYRSGNIRYSAIGKKSKIDAGGCSDNLSNYPAADFYAIRNYSVMFHSIKKRSA